MHLHFSILFWIVSLIACDDQQAISDGERFKHPTFENRGEKGLVYFSSDAGSHWKNRSDGLPDSLFLTDIAASGQYLSISTKKNGIFLFNSQNNTWKQTSAQPSTRQNVDALVFYQKKMIAGTEKTGVFVSDDLGNSWARLNEGLGNWTIRKFAIIDNILYVGTNAGLFALNNREKKWESVYTQGELQVNGITEFGNEIYIGTNRGAFKNLKGESKWKPVLSDRALHNISSDDNTVYAMTYSELLSSANHGNTWQSIQKGLPDRLYTFHVLRKGNVVLAAQWNGVYRKESLPIYNANWVLSSHGLPEKFAATEMNVYKDNVVIASSTRNQSYPLR